MKLKLKSSRKEKSEADGHNQLIVKKDRLTLFDAELRRTTFDKTNTQGVQCMNEIEWLDVYWN